MKQACYTVLRNEPLAPQVWRMVLEGDTACLVAPGQFVNVSVEGCFLRRPISMCDYDDRTLTLIYKVVGTGTARMTALPAGGRVELLAGLGNGFSPEPSSRRPVLVGGGVGVPPLFKLAKVLLERGVAPQVVVGFGKAAEAFLLDDFRALGIEPTVTTLDGSLGLKGVVTDALHDTDADYFYACGPKAMLRAVCETMPCEGQVSLEERMGCGFGACMGCTCVTRSGPRRVCAEGPVFTKSEMIWQ